MYIILKLAILHNDYFYLWYFMYILMFILLFSYLSKVLKAVLLLVTVFIKVCSSFYTVVLLLLLKLKI